MSSPADPGQHIFWIASRSLGVVALILVAVSVGIGLAMSMRLLKGPGMTSRVRQLHEATALTALIAVAGHGLALLGDSYLRPGIEGITVPFAMSHAQLWTGLGVIGGWLAAILGLSFYVRRWFGPRLWRSLHRWTLAVYVLALLHTIGAGTDAGSGWLQVIIVATAAPIGILAAMRLLPGGDPPARRVGPRVTVPTESA